ncbi:MAG: hypothetical protein ACLTTJ_14095 [Blautia sp.]
MARKLKMNLNEYMSVKFPGQSIWQRSVSAVRWRKAWKLPVQDIGDRISRHASLERMLDTNVNE